jgi:multiple sugar transport system permease protein
MDNALHHAPGVEPQPAAQAALDEGQATVQEQLDLLFGAKTYPPLDTGKAALAAGLMGLALLAVFLFLLRRQIRATRGVTSRGEVAAGYAFASPWLIGFLIFTAGPIIVSIILSLARYDVLHPPEYVAGDSSACPWAWPSVWASPCCSTPRPRA